MIRRIFFASVLLLCLSCSDSSSNVFLDGIGLSGSTWRLVSLSGPPGRIDHPLAYDRGRGVTLLFGGRNPQFAGVAFDDTWEWDGTTWDQRFPADTPPARSRHGLAYDVARGVTVLFGGKLPGNALGQDDTWTWNGSNWTEQVVGARPSGRFGHAMAYDAARGVVLLFGGDDGDGGTPLFNDTWTWDGTSWTEVTPSGTSPSPRTDAAMAFDAVRGVMVLFGGRDLQTGAILNDTWEWNGSDWNRRFPTDIPPATDEVEMVYHSTRDEVILFVGGFENETWRWTGSDWDRFFPNSLPDTNSAIAAAFDDARDRIVLFGVFAGTTDEETWEFIVD